MLAALPSWKSIEHTKSDHSFSVNLPSWKKNVFVRYRTFNLVLIPNSVLHLHWRSPPWDSYDFCWYITFHGFEFSLKWLHFLFYTAINSKWCKSSITKSWRNGRGKKSFVRLGQASVPTDSSGGLQERCQDKRSKICVM